MTMALRSRVRLKALVSVDNAPVEAALKSDFSKYVRGLEEVERANVSNQGEADEILKSYEEVCLFSTSLHLLVCNIPPTQKLIPGILESRHCRSGNFCSRI